MSLNESKTMKLLNVSILIFLFLVFHSPTGDAQLAAIAVDLGGQFMKVGLVKPGVPMEIVLNRESRRKTSSIVAIRNGERLFSESAETVRVRHPKDCYVHFIDLLGKKFDNPVVHDFQRRFSFYTLVPDENRGTVLFQNEDHFYSPEELTAFLLSEAKSMAEAFAEQPIKDAVITVPPYFNQAERRAVVHAADIAGLNLLQLMNDNSATGVNYGMFRRKQFNETPSNVLVYDMGAHKTTATILEYKLIKEKGISEKNPQMTVLGVGYDRSLGGLEVTLRIRDILVEKFRKEVKTSKDVTQVPRAMAKLFKEAERLKTVLSANLDHVAQIENVMEEKDFKSKIKREEYELRSPDLWDRINGPIERALKMAEQSLDQIDTVLLMGGATRVPMVQDRLKWFLGGREPAKYLNMDEAVALGAVYQAAHLSKGFKVKKFHVKEATLFPIQVDFERELALGESKSGDGGKKVIHRVLFGLKNPYPQKKVMTFSKHQRDFEFAVNYGDMKGMSKHQLKEFGELNISRVDLTGVEKAFDKHKTDGTEYRGVKAHFRLDDSGILHLDGADVVVEKSAELVEKEEAEASTLSKIGSKIADFFGGSKSEEVKKDDNDEKESEKEAEEETKEQKKHEKSTEKEDKKENDTDKKDEKKADKDKKTDKDEKKDKKDKKDNKTEEATTKAPPKPATIKIPLNVEASPMDLPNITAEDLKVSKQRLENFAKLEKEKAKREKLQNELESFVFETKDKLEQEEYTTLTTDKEREAILEKLKTASDWMDEEVGPETKVEDYETQLKTLKDATKDLFYKHEEYRERPRAREAIAQMLNYSSMFLVGMRNLTEDTQVFTETEMNSLEKVINETEKWWKDKEEEQKKLANHEKPIMTMRNVAEKITSVDREVKYLLNKAKIAKPLKVKKEEEEAKKKAKEDAEKLETQSSETSKKDDKEGSQSKPEKSEKSGESTSTETPPTDQEEKPPSTATEEKDIKTKTKSDSSSSSSTKDKNPDEEDGEPTPRTDL